MPVTSKARAGGALAMGKGTRVLKALKACALMQEEAFDSKEAI